MRLWVQLSLAFVFVILATVLIATLLAQTQVTGYVRQYAQQEHQISMAATLTEHYLQTGSWAGVASVLQQPGAGGRGMGRGRQAGKPLLVLTDPTGGFLASSQGINASTVPPDGLTLPIEVDGTVVGLLHASPPGHAEGTELSPGMAEMLRVMSGSLWLAGALAAGAGIALSVLLTYRIAAPLDRLAQAAHHIASGSLGQHVALSGSHEIDRVAAAFNQMSASLQQSEQARRNLLADVAHELRTPISVLQGNLRALLDGVYPLNPGEIAILYDEVLLLHRLVADVRDLAQAEVGQLHVDLQPTDLAALAARFTALFVEVGATQQVTVQIIGPTTLRPVRADPARTQQVLSNLLTNALRHTPTGGTITVQISEQSMGVLIAVSDTGTGIAAADLSHIFERYWRAAPGNSHSSGLGLAIARQLVLAQGGEIGVESSEGSGSRFWFTLPWAALPYAANGPSAPDTR
ncbi:MAG: HAMP domain-containing histidine kinase [Chloroflexaceae bacterium]|nr:HAMP domain-containing histidine kinase [Chloroflexaceae bacterium]